MLFFVIQTKHLQINDPPIRTLWKTLTSLVGIKGGFYHLEITGNRILVQRRNKERTRNFIRTIRSSRKHPHKTEHPEGMCSLKRQFKKLGNFLHWRSTCSVLALAINNELTFAIFPSCFRFGGITGGGGGEGGRGGG